MARYKDDPNYPFWTNLKEGYDHFEITRTPPKVDVCEKRYVFNAVTDGTKLSPTGKCPAIAQPDSLKTAYQSYQSSYEAAFASALGTSGSSAIRKPSISGLKEAALVSEWTKRRARGERVPIEPPTLAADGTVVQATTRMGRIDSPEGRRMAEKEAAEEAKRQAKLKKDAEKAAALAAAELAKNPPPPPEPAPVVASEPAATETPGMLGRIGKRFTGMFGG
jgi:hypothetical protein